MSIASGTIIMDIQVFEHAIKKLSFEHTAKTGIREFILRSGQSNRIFPRAPCYLSFFG